jgi:alkyl hydroperoxide reductase subunit AhpC
MPALQRLHEELHDQRPADRCGERRCAAWRDRRVRAAGWQCARLRHEFGLTFTVLHDPDGRIQSRYQVNGLPTTYIIDRDGRIRRKVLGAAEWDRTAFADQIRDLLEG